MANNVVEEKEMVLNIVEHILKAYHTVEFLLNHPKKHTKPFKFGYRKFMVFHIISINSIMYMTITILLIIEKTLKL